MSKRLVALLAIAGLYGGMVGAAHAGTSNPIQVCPIVKAIDPDFVSFLGPASIPGDRANHSVAIFASESEAAANLVTLTAVATAHVAGKPALTIPIVAAGNGIHDTTVTLSLNGTPGRSYTIDWVATFDFGPHICAWAFPGHQAFKVAVG